LRDERIINHKLAEAMKLGAEGLDIRWEGLRRTEDGPVAADLIISVGGTTVKYNVYLRGDAVELQFRSTNRSRVELAAHLLRLVGVSAEVKKMGDRDVWYVRATTDMLAAGHEKLRKALAEIVEAARGKGWVEAGKAERWLKKLERGRVLMEGWPKFYVGLSSGGALAVRYETTNSDSIKQVVQRLRDMGLVENRHFTVKMPEGGERGYVLILRRGLERAARLSVRGEGEQQRLAAEFVELILQRAKEAGKEVRKKVEEIVKKGKERGSLTLKGFKERVEVNGKTYVVEVKGGEAVEEDRDDRKLLRIKITAEVSRVEGGHIVDRVESEYEITYGRYHKNAAVAYARAEVDDAERLAAVIKALTGKEPWIRRKSSNKIELKCYEGHLEGFMRYAELVDVIESWLEETSR